MISALPSFSNRPILGYIHKVITEENPEGQWEFYGHNMHEDENGDVVYDEIPIGIIPESCNAQLVYDEDKKKTYCEVDGYIFEEYSKAAEILQREGECAVSVELSIRELSYDGKQKCLNIEDFWFSGVTILGKTPNGDEVKPGMQGSNIKLADFSAENNSLFVDYKNQMIELQERLEKLETACFNKDQNNGQNDYQQEGGRKNSMDKLNELLSKYGKTIEDVDFDYEGLTDEELESKFKSVFGEEQSDDDDNADSVDNPEDNSSDDEPSDDEEAPKINKNESEDESDENSDEKQSDDPIAKEDEACGGGGSGSTKKKKKNSKDELFNELFEISFDEIRYALNALCSIYRNDSEWCYVSQVYEDYFIMEDWDSNKYYKQSYTKDGDNVSLSGERIEMFAMLLTESEKLSIEEMRSNYSSIVEQLNTYKSEKDFADKMTVFDDDAYADYLDTEEFKALMSKESVNQYSKEQLSEKADATLGKLVKKNKTFSYSEKTEKQPTVVFMSNSNSDKESKKKAPYGGIFDKYNK